LEDKIKNWKTGNHDLEILKDMASMPIKDVHTKYYPGKSPIEAAAYFNNLLQKIKLRIRNYRQYLRQVNKICKNSPYVQKRLILPKTKKDKLTIQESVRFDQRPVR